MPLATPKDSGSKKPRSLERIHKAHDVLRAIIEDNIFPDIPDEQLDLIKACSDVLCWVLGHKSTFGWRLENTEQLLKDMGIVFSKQNDPKTS